MKLGIGLLGLVFPWVMAWHFFPAPSPKEVPLYQKEFLPAIPTWIWLSVAALAICVRFYKLTTLSVWPLYDEGSINYSALELSRKWDWRLFYFSSQSPPAYAWGLGLFFKIFGVSLGTLWFFPALVSLLTVPVGYFAFRQYFSKSFSFLLLLFLAGSFWPFYAGRYSLMTVLIPFWECLAFYFLGKYLNAPLKDQKTGSLFLGMIVGAGFYIHISWPPIAGFIGLVVLAVSLKRKSGFSHFFIFSMAAIFLFFPLVLAAIRQGYGWYLNDLWAFSKSSPIHNQLETSLDYLAVPFWGFQDHIHPYYPAWGGFLNPILGSAFFLACLEMFKNRTLPLYRCLGIGLVMFLVPALLTKTLEPFRLLPLMPLILAAAALGLSRFLSFSPVMKPFFVVSGIFLASFALDFYHLAGPYRKTWETPSYWNTKSFIRFKADEILKQKARNEGQGLIFTDFSPGFCDQTLTLSTYAYNQVWNPELLGEKFKWAAVLVNVHYRPFLAKRFPDGKAYFLDKEAPEPNGGTMLWVMPVTPNRQEVMARWEKAAEALKPFIHQFLSYVHGQSFQPVRDSLLQAYPYFRGDPFLESCFWEKAADNDLKMGFQDHRESIQDIRQALKSGYPATHLYYTLGTLLYIDRNRVEAREAFQQASHAPMNFTNADQLLRELWQK